MFEIFLMIFCILFIVLFALLMIPVLVLMERKVSGFIQDRPGPNRTNIAGIRLGGVVQSLGDAAKLIFKEDFLPRSIERKFLFRLAPMWIFFTSLVTFSVIPFADYFFIDSSTPHIMQGIAFESGLLWYLGFVGLGVYGTILAGYSSNNKYSLLGSLRAASSTISYEVPLALSLVSMILTYNSINLNDFVHFQEGSFWGLPSWGVFVQPLAAIIFITTAFAETGRTPFDLAEGESEIVGYHTEYSAMSFGMFFMAEYIAMTAASALIVTIFFGGYSLPYLSSETIKANSEIVLICLGGFTTLFCIAFLAWLYKNNVTRYKTTIDKRKKENKFYLFATIVVIVLVDLSVAFFLFFGTNDLSKEFLSASIQIGTFMTKTILMTFVFIWVRWTLPRFRYDQLQKLCWEKLLPLAIVNLIVTALVVHYGN